MFEILQQWRDEEYEHGSRVKASKIQRALEKMVRREYEHRKASYGSFDNSKLILLEASPRTNIKIPMPPIPPPTRLLYDMQEPKKEEI